MKGKEGIEGSGHTTNYAFSRPLYVMLKPAGSQCNLRCSYCYYLEKGRLYQTATGHTMSDELLEKFIRQYMEAQTMPEVLFTWHGGEPLLRPIDFYRRALQLQRIYGRGRPVANCIQTNGTLLNDEWCRFFRENNFLVGISIDGPQPFHDSYRHTAGGQSSFEQVMRGIELLKKHRVEWNAMATANHYNCQDPIAFYHFFRDELKCKFLQISPVVERIKEHSDGRHLAQLFDEDCPIAPFSIRPEEWGHFMCAIFDDWVKHDVGEMFVQLFDATLAGWLGEAPGVCVYAEECGHAAVMEQNGDLYSCDHFVFPQYKLGNIRTHGLPQMLYGTKQSRFSRLKREALPRQCRECQWLKACHGECPRLRFLRTADGEPGLNYLCAGYRIFFQHVAPYMDYMMQELLAGRPASGVMSLF